MVPRYMPFTIIPIIFAEIILELLIHARSLGDEWENGRDNGFNPEMGRVQSVFCFSDGLMVSVDVTSDPMHY